MSNSKHVVPGDSALVAIGYKYNSNKVLSFITTYENWIKKSGIAYSYKYPDRFADVSI